MSSWQEKDLKNKFHSSAVVYLFIYTTFQEGDIHVFSSTASLPYGPLNI